MKSIYSLIKLQSFDKKQETFDVERFLGKIILNLSKISK